jgi:hypothetical protein
VDNLLLAFYVGGIARSSGRPKHETLQGMRMSEEISRDTKLQKMREMGETLKRRHDKLISDVQDSLASRLDAADHDQPVSVDQFIGSR